MWLAILFAWYLSNIFFTVVILFHAAAFLFNATAILHGAVVIFVSVPETLCSNYFLGPTTLLGGWVD